MEPGTLKKIIYLDILEIHTSALKEVRFKFSRGNIDSGVFKIIWP